MSNEFTLNIPERLMKYKPLLQRSIVPYVSISTIKQITTVWQSKFGGKPYWPIKYNYPLDSTNKPMQLLAQINFSELPAISDLPQTGILQIFISTVTDYYGINFDNLIMQEDFKIIYHPELLEDKQKLYTDFSFIESINYERFPITEECVLNFEYKYAPVPLCDFQFEKYFGQHVNTFLDDKKYEEEGWSLYENLYPGAGHKIGGYARFAQTDPREDTIYHDYNILLLQIDTDEESGISWGDGGVANFFIRHQDLIKLDFTNIIYNWDCY